MSQYLPYTVTALARITEQDGKNVVTGAVIRVFADGVQQTMYEDAEGLNPSMEKQSDINGLRTIFLPTGSYELDVNNRRTGFSVGDPDLQEQFNELFESIEMPKQESFLFSAVGAGNRFTLNTIVINVASPAIIGFRNGVLVKLGVEFSVIDANTVKVLYEPNLPDDEWVFFGSGFANIPDLTGGSGVQVFDSFSQMVDSDLKGALAVTRGYYADSPNVGTGTYIKSSLTGTLGETDGGSYFIDIYGNRWELLHDGTVLLEQFGAREDTPMGLIPRPASAANGVTKVTTNLSKLVMDKIWPVDRSNIWIDFNNADIDWIGVYNIYYDEYNLGVPEAPNAGVATRQIGVINWRSIPDDSDVRPVTNTITDGTCVITLDNVSGIAEGDYINLSIQYPRNLATQIAKVVSIDGNNIGIDYTFAWDVDSCEVRLFEPFRNIKVTGIGVFNDQAIWEEREPSVFGSWGASGIGLRGCVDVLIEGGDFVNTNNPAVMIYECSRLAIRKVECANPRVTTGGRGYTIQVNNSCFWECSDCVGFNTRHVWDSSGASNGVVQRCSSTITRGNSSFSFGTHGKYEHDITISECFDFGSRLSVSLARAGLPFGAASRRIVIENSAFSGLLFSENVDDLTVKDTDFYGLEPGGTGHRVPVRGVCNMQGVKFHPETVVVVAKHQYAPQIAPMDDGIINFNDCKLPRALKHFFHGGTYRINGGSGLRQWFFEGVYSVQPEPNWPKAIYISNTDIEINSSSQYRANELIQFNNVGITTDETTQALICFDGAVEFNNVKAYHPTAKELRVRAPITKVTGGEWNNVGVVPELGTAIRYELSGLNAAAATNLWRAVNTTNLAGIAANCTFTGTGGLQLGGAGSTGTTWRLSNVTSEYNMLTDAGSIVSSVRYRGVTSPTLNDWATWP